MHIVLITTDQHKAATIGAYGDPLGATPNLDALAATATTYLRARTQNPYCQGSRASILTGTHPTTHGIVRNGIDLPETGGPASIATLLGEGGFDSALFGKAHFASYYPDFPTGAIESVADGPAVAPDWYGPFHGFDHVELTSDVHNVRLAPQVGRWNWGFGPPPFGLHYGRWLFRDGHERGVERLRLLQPEAAGRAWGPSQTWPNQVAEEDHVTTWTADVAIDWIERRAATPDRPFFAWVSFDDPHHPFDPPSPWSGRFTPADMAEVLPHVPEGDLDGKSAFHQMWTTGFRGSEMEWANPGWARFDEEEKCEILAAYYGMIAQTDHAIGRVLGAIERAGLVDDTLVVFTADHGDLMGDHDMMLKGPLHYEALIGVPLLVRGPGFEPGARTADPVGTVDLAPTFLDGAGLPVPDEIEGRSLHGPAREHVLTEDDTAAGMVELRTLTTATHRLTLDLVDERNSELYDHETDPGEHENRWHDPALAALRDDLVAELEATRNHTLARELPQVCAAG